jgi:hypothetical protein
VCVSTVRLPLVLTPLQDISERLCTERDALERRLQAEHAEALRALADQARRDAEQAQRAHDTLQRDLQAQLDRQRQTLSDREAWVLCRGGIACCLMV